MKNGGLDIYLTENELPPAARNKKTPRTGKRGSGCESLVKRGRLLEASDGLFEDLLGLSLVAPARAGDFLVWLQILVTSEEVLDLVLLEVGNIGDVLQVVPANVVDDAEQLVVAASLIGHLKDAERTSLHNDTWENWLWQDHECVEWVAIFTEGVVDEAVVQRVCHWGEQVAVQVDLAGLVVNFVLVAGTLWDLDGYFNAHMHSLVDQKFTTIVAPEPQRHRLEG